MSSDVGFLERILQIIQAPRNSFCYSASKPVLAKDFLTRPLRYRRRREWAPNYKTLLLGKCIEILRPWSCTKSTEQGQETLFVQPIPLTFNVVVRENFLIERLTNGIEQPSLVLLGGLYGSLNDICAIVPAVDEMRSRLGGRPFIAGRPMNCCQSMV